MRRSDSPPSIPNGRRVYAIGDVHGRLDLLDALICRIADDNAGRGSADVEVVMLGDLIDRGPDSAGVVARLMAPPEWARFIVLQGNHEAAMLATLDGDRDMCRLWLRNGGDTALASWGVSGETIKDATIGELIDAARAAIPSNARSFLARTRLSHVAGDYYFVHAGVRPGVALDRQVAADQMWIREAFLDSRANHGKVVVHGHSVCTEIEERPNRIGLDTGAYRTGRLTALGLEGSERWSLQTEPVGA